jgi:cell division protein FtsB
MRSFERKKDKKNIWESRPILVILGVVILVFSWNVIRFWNKMNETSRNTQLLEARAAALRQQKETLVADIEELKTDRGKEEVFRTNYGLAKEGEEVVIVVEEEKPPKEQPVSFWDGILNSFKNLFK